MPAEAMRLQRRLGTRDRWFIALLVSAVLIGTLATIVAGRARADSSSEAGARCVAVSRASWMGSATIRYCGAQAVAYCRDSTTGQSAAGHAQSVAECERAGLRTAG
jgi:hypothetical protein